MADITSAEIVRVSNESVRPMAEALILLAAQLFVLQPNIDRLLPSIPNDADSMLLDGSPADSRTPLSGEDYHKLAAVATRVGAIYTPEVAALLAKAAVRTVQFR